MSMWPAWRLVPRSRVHGEVGLELGLCVEDGPAEEGEDGALVGEGSGDAGADDACCADDGAVLAGE